MGGIRIALQWKNQQYRWPGQGNFFKVMKISITQSLERAGQQHTDSFPQLPLVLRYKRQYETEGMSSEHWKILLLFLTSSKLWCKWLLHLSSPGHCVPVNVRERITGDHKEQLARKWSHCLRLPIAYHAFLNIYLTCPITNEPQGVKILQKISYQTLGFFSTENAWQ